MTEEAVETETPEVTKTLGTGAREAVGGDESKSYVAPDEIVSHDASLVVPQVPSGAPEPDLDGSDAPDHEEVDEAPGHPAPSDKH